MSNLRIADVETILLSYRYTEEELWKWSGGATRQRNAVLLRITTDNGIVGMGEIGESAFLPRVVEKIIDCRLKPMLIGEDPFDIEKLMQKLFIRSAHWGRKGVAVAVISGIDIALWDIMGKALGVPVYELLGGKYRTRFRVYASAGMAKPLPALIDELKDYIAQGYTGVKLRIGKEDPVEDIAIVREVRKAIGDDIALMVDAGQCYTDFPWDYHTALRVCKKLEDCDLFWLEEPLMPDDLEGFVRLTANTSVPIVAGENEFTKYGFKELIARHAVDMIQPDVTRTGGILECKKVAGMAAAFGMKCAPHIFGSGVGLMANMHFMASTPNAFIMEHDKTLNPLREAMLMEPLVYENGYVKLVEGIPGIGAELTDETIRKYPFNDADAVDKADFVPLF
jgi:L-alanine-DL-glutamate epimerase-like enolase superfamily enzyme